MLTTQKKELKEKARTLINWVDLLKGIYQFNKTQNTPSKAYQAMIRLHGRKNGQSTHWLANHYATMPYQKSISSNVSGVLGHLNAKDIFHIVNEIKEKGYYVFDQVVPENICQKIENFALETPALIEADNLEEYQNERAVFNPLQPISKTYRLPEQSLISFPLIQDLMADASIRAIAKAYVQAEPVLASVNTWFSPAYKPEIHGGASAQDYHFDMSRCRWLNFFLYLNDVDYTNGPHCFIKGSHKHTNKKGHHLLKRGYVRIPDQDIYQAYGKNNEIQFVSKKGTIIVEDTLGFHKGLIPLSGYRSIFELVYSVNLFGGAYHKYTLPEHITPSLKEALNHHPISYQRYGYK